MLNLKTILASIALATGMTSAQVNLGSNGLPTQETIKYIYEVCYYKNNEEYCSRAHQTVFTSTTLNPYWREFHYQCLGKKSYYSFRPETVDCETAKKRLAVQGYSVGTRLINKEFLDVAAGYLNKN
jgi:anaerobic ribonucleoside-triphosphate reductase